MAEETKACNIGDCMNTCTCRICLKQCLACFAVQLYHRSDGSFQITYFHLFTFVRCRNQACPKRFAENKQISRLCPTLGENTLRMNHPCHRKPILWLPIAHAMAARDDSSRLSNNLRATT